METTTIKASQVINDFIASIDQWDRDNSIFRYDIAIMQDAAKAIERIESMREKYNSQ